MQAQEEQVQEQGYEPPRLRELGSLRELTRNGQDGGLHGSYGHELGPMHK
jgi:hypothetical protein